jgi:hypothetical protein
VLNDDSAATLPILPASERSAQRRSATMLPPPRAAIRLLSPPCRSIFTFHFRAITLFSDTTLAMFRHHFRRRFHCRC